MSRRHQPNSIDLGEVVQICDSVHKHAGLSCSPEQVLHAVKNVAKKRKGEVRGVLQKLSISTKCEDWDSLLTELTIPETFFFRLQDHWEALSREIIPRLRETRQQLSVWCAACATGEEAYSLAMTFESLGVPARIHATDLVQNYLTFAKAGIYSTRALRGQKLDLLNAGADIDDHSVTIRNSIKERVTFSQLNLLDQKALDAHTAKHGPFDIIFCRNVLIYFSPAMCAQLVERFSKALRLDGYLFLGAAEFPGLWTTAVVPELLGKAYVWRPTAGKESLSLKSTIKTENSPKERPSDNSTTTIHVDEHSLDSFGKLFEMLSHPTRYSSEHVVGLARMLVDKHELDVRAHVALGLAFEMSEKSRDAISAYSQAIFLDKKCAFSHWRQAVMYSVQHEPAQALRSAKWAKDVASNFGCGAFCPPGLSIDELQEAIDETLQWLTV